MLLVIGLGNPGEKYRYTRHNAGFIVINMLADKYGIRLNKTGCHAVYGEGNVGSQKIVLAQPQTFMNESGISVRELMNKYHATADEIIIIYDDMDFPCGVAKLRESGSAGSHNGMKSIIYHLETDKFPRIRMGISRPPKDEKGKIDYVLGEFTPDEQKLMMQAGETALNAVDIAARRSFSFAMNMLNKKQASKPKAESENQ